MRRCTKVGIVLAACVGALTLRAEPAQPGFPAPQGRLLYIGETVFGPSVFEVNPDGTGNHVLQLPSTGLNGGVDSAASGTRLAFTTTTTSLLTSLFKDQLPPKIRRRLPDMPPSVLGLGDFTPLVLNGSGEITIQSGPDVAAYGRPSWSPDGASLAFAGGKPGQLDIYVLSLAGGGKVTDLTPNSPGNDSDPAWSPDGKTIAFASQRNGTYDLFTMSPSGQGVSELTGGPARDRFADWSPDGSRLVYASNATGNDQLYVIAATGGIPQRLTNDDGNDRHPAWSPDGKSIAFSSDREGENDIYLIDPTGASERRVTSTVIEEIVEDWQPLHDAVAPTVKALRGVALRRHPVVLRFRLADNSGRAKVAITIDTGGAEFEVGRFRYRAATGRKYGIRLTGTDLNIARISPRFRFCMRAFDPSGNTSKTSCASYRVR